jgi:hypothetical protein
LPHAGELFVVPADDHVALPDAGGGRRTRFIDTHHHRADAVVELDGLQANPEIAARDAAVGFEPACDAFDRGCRNDEHAARSQHGHADRLAGSVECEPALLAVMQADIELDPRVDVAATKAAPAAADMRYHAERRAGCAARCGDDDCERTEGRHAGRKSCRRDLFGIEPQQRDIGGVIAAHDGGRPRRSIGKLDRDFAFLRQRLVGGHEEPRLPDEAGRARAMRMHRDDRRRRFRDDTGDGG